jgi:hypothetical protein
MDYLVRRFQLSRISGRLRQRLVTRDQSLSLGSILWIMLQVCLQLPRTSGRLRQRLVSQDLALRLRSIVIVWIMLQVCLQLPRTSGRQRQRLVSRDLTLPLRSILWIMLQVCLQLLGHQVGRVKGWCHETWHCACAANCGLCCKYVYSC